MIKKEELLRILKDAMISEEKAIPILTRHLRSAVFWTGMDKEKTEKVKSVLRQLAEESEGHKRVMETLINRITKEKRDAF